MIELTALKKVRERIKELGSVYGLGHMTKCQARVHKEVTQVEQQFQSDLRAIEAELIELQKTITAAIVVYDHYRSGQPIRHAIGKTEKAKFLWTFDALRNPLFTGLDSAISAIDSALKVGEK